MRFAIVALLIITCCASAPLPDPTPDKPRIGCVQDSMAVQSSVPGKLLPRVVRVIGRYDETQLKVIFPGQFNDRWVPIDQRLVRFAGCGADIDAYREIFTPIEGSHR